MFFSILSCNDVNVLRDDIDRNFTVHVWRAENSLKIVSKHPKSRKICYNVSNVHLKMGCHLLTIYTQNWHFRFNTVHTFFI